MTNFIKPLILAPLVFLAGCDGDNDINSNVQPPRQQQTFEIPSNKLEPAKPQGSDTPIVPTSGESPQVLDELPPPVPLPGIGQQFALSPTGIPYPKLATLLPNRKGPIVEDGMILPWLSNRPALPLEEIHVVTQVDSDEDGEKDRVALRIVKPTEVAEGLKTPVIIRASIYYADPTYATDARGPFLGEDFYLRSGFTIVYADTLGSFNSTGCPTIMDQQERDGMKAVVEWLTRAEGSKAFDKDGNEVTADWSTQHVAMEGVSYGGTLAWLAASTGVEGLEAIVPVAAVTNAYDYFNRYDGVRTRDTVSLEGYASGETSNPEKCQASQRRLDIGVDNQGLAYTEFWAARNPLTVVKAVRAATLISHGQSDNNVKTQNSTKLFDALVANKKPAQFWFHTRSHTDPAWQKEWQKQILLWYTRYLFGVNNGVEQQPTYVRETPIGSQIAGDLSNPDKEDRSNSLVGHCYHWRNSPRACSTTGEFLVREAKMPQTTQVGYELVKTLSDASQFSVADRKTLSYTLPTVEDATRISGTISVDLDLTLDQANIPDIEVALYVDDQRVTYGWGTLKFRDDITKPATVNAGEDYRLNIRLMPRDFTLPPGSTARLDISGFLDTLRAARNTVVTLNEKRSMLYLPIVNGNDLATDAVQLSN